MPVEPTRTKVGLYVDAANLFANGGRGMRYDVLRDFACRGGAQAVRLNAYVSYDARRAETDAIYRRGQFEFHQVLRDLGFKVIEKEVKWYVDESGQRFGKANVDLDLAVDALLQSENIDRVLLATGDGDFVQVVRALQNRGCRVEIVAFDNVSADLRRECDLFMSGYLIPNLLPVLRNRGGPPWGELGSVVRGTCYSRDPVRQFGFLRYLYRLDGDLWKIDTRQPDSPYRTLFCHDSQMPENLDLTNLPSRNMVLEFEIAPANDPTKGHQAVHVNWVNARWQGVD